MQQASFTSLKTGKSYSVIITDDPPGGAQLEVFFAPNKSYAIGVYKEMPDEVKIRQLNALVFEYRDQVLRGEDAEETAFLNNLFCWPMDIVSKDGYVGVVMPSFPSRFFFKLDHFPVRKGCEKKAGWFLSPYSKFFRVPPTEAGDWKDIVHCALALAKGVRRLHMVGMAHADISPNNVLVDPVTRTTLITGVLDMVILGRFDGKVLGTPDYIAPEVVAAQGTSGAFSPNLDTDKHALAVLIYQMLLCRHPLKGKHRFGDVDDWASREMGADALFVENPTDMRARYDAKWVKNDCKKPKELPYLFPWRDLDKLPYTVLGPYLSPLVERAFVDGLHNPRKRPIAAEWEFALEKTIPFLHNCANPDCPAKWFVLCDHNKCVCPFCGREALAAV